MAALQRGEAMFALLTTRYCYGIATNREDCMSKELYWLMWTVVMTGLLWVPYVLDRIMVRGAMGAMANPSPTDKPQSAWAQRMLAAHNNTVENLAVFAPLVLVAQTLNIHT